jgi:Ankyrin repeat
MSGHGKFAIHESIDRQMAAFTTLRETDPVLARRLYTTGEVLVELASQGSLRKLIGMIDSIDKAELLSYFTLRMLRQAMLNNHLMVASYIIDNGYPINTSSVPNVLNECLATVEDYHGVSLVEFLVRTKGYDVNLTSQQTWVTALHVAVKHQLINTIKTLIELGADVNAVASGDRMPLTEAMEASTDSDARDEIIEILTLR